MAENNFFYSGMNGCCEDFDFIAGELIPNPPTTTTTSTTGSPTTTTTTTNIPMDCNLIGTATTNNIPTTTTTTTTSTPCYRPQGLTLFTLITGYINEGIPYISTGSQEEACAALDFLTGNQDYNVQIIPLGGYATGVAIGVTMYSANNTYDCECIPDGWYFTDETLYYGNVFHVENCIITEIANCTVTTTTTLPLCNCYRLEKDGGFGESLGYIDCDGLSQYVDIGPPIPVVYICARSIDYTIEVEVTNLGLCSEGGCITTTTTTTLINPTIDCGTTVDQVTNNVYPFSQIINVSGDVGTCYFSANMQSIPDRMIVTWDGIVQIDTGYAGAPSYDYGGINRIAFNASIYGKIDPITLNSYPDYGTYPDDGYPRLATSLVPIYGSFDKTGASPTTATVDVYAPMYKSEWKFNLECPSITTSTTSTSSTSSSTTTTTTTLGPETYGELYNWFAANNDDLPIPTNKWKVATDDDWVGLGMTMPGASMSGLSVVHCTVPLKSAGNITDGTGLWVKATDPLMEGTNTSGFNVTPSGAVDVSGSTAVGRNIYANFWAYDERSTPFGKYRHFDYNGNVMYTNAGYYLKNYGFSVRLVNKDAAYIATHYPNPGDTGTVTDYDGNVYPTKLMPDGKVWMTENLRVQHYNNGVAIAVNPADWATRTTGAIHTYQGFITTTTTTTYP